MKKFIKYLTAFLFFVLALCVAVASVASYMFDKKINLALKKFNDKQNKLELFYESKAHTFFSKKGLLYVNINKTPLGQVKLCFDLELDFSLNGVSAQFQRLSHKGNLDELLSAYNIPSLKLSGSARVDPVALKGTFDVNIDGFDYSLLDGMCTVGSQRLYAKNSSLNTVNVIYETKGINCKSSKLYNARPAYMVLLEDLKLSQKVNIDRKAKQFSLDTTNLDINRILLDSSTLYLIGFEPEDEVKDKSIRDRVDLSKLSLKGKLVDKGAGNYSVLLDMNNSLSFAFPYMKKNRVVQGYDFENMHTSFEFGKFNLKKIENILKFGDYTELPKALSNPLDLNVKDYSFTLKGAKARTSGLMRVMFDDNQKLKDAYLDFYLEGEKKLIDEYLSKEYLSSFNIMLNNSLISRNNDKYKTHFVFKDKKVTFNDKEMDFSSDDSEESDDITLQNDDLLDETIQIKIQ